MSRLRLQVGSSERRAASAVRAARAYAGQAAGVVSYDGRFTRGDGMQVFVAGVLHGLGAGVRGAIAINLDEHPSGGLYGVTGRMQGRRLVLEGRNGSGVELRWSGYWISPLTLRGAAMLISADERVLGMLVLTRASELALSPIVVPNWFGLGSDGEDSERGEVPAAS